MYFVNSARPIHRTARPFSGCDNDQEAAQGVYIEDT